MTEAYRQKLLNWLTSMMVLILATSCFLVTIWFHEVLIAIELAGTNRFTVYLARMAGPLSLFIVGFQFAAAWHLMDFVQAGESSRRLVRSISSYRTALITGIGIIVICAIIYSGVLSRSDCNRSYGFEGCAIGPPAWVMTTYLAVLLFAVLLCMTKAAISIRSRIQKAS